MASLRWLVFFVVAGVVAVGVRAADNSKEVKKLEGTWVVTSATFNGKAMDELKEGLMTIAGDKLTTKGKDGKEFKQTFKVDPTKKPKTMDLKDVEKLPSTRPGLVIYDLDGDTLRLVLGPPNKRPTEFADKGHPLITFKRKK
jgi:uncharacterized protein (TIGR03067 family)